MSSPAKKYPELSGCMTCNTKLTVLNPGPRPAFTHAGTGKRLLHGCCSWTSRRQERFSSPVNPYALMTSSNFICARSSVPVDWREAGKRWGSDIFALFQFMALLQNRSYMWTRSPLQNDTFSSQTVSQYGWKRTCRFLKALLSKERRCSNKEEREEDGVGNDAVISNLTWSIQKTHWHSVQNLKMNSSLFFSVMNSMSCSTTH